MQASVGTYRFKDGTCELDSDYSNNDKKFRHLTIEDEGRNDVVAYLESGQHNFDIAVNRAPFRAFDGVRYGARIRFRFKTPG